MIQQKDTSLCSVWRNICHSEGNARRICTIFCHPELSWISFTKTSRSFHYVSTHFCFCNFGSALLLRPTQIRSFQGLVVRMWKRYVGWVLTQRKILRYAQYDAKYFSSFWNIQIGSCSTIFVILRAMPEESVPILHHSVEFSVEWSQSTARKSKTVAPEESCLINL